jgi:hypothetical protein
MVNRVGFTPLLGSNRSIIVDIVDSLLLLLLLLVNDDFLLLGNDDALYGNDHIDPIANSSAGVK